MSSWIEGLAMGWMLLFFGAGLGLLAYGGDKLCRGAVHLARILRVPSVVVGLTVVSIATSMPELFTSLVGALRGSPGLAVGNIVGSNIANIGLILAIAALVCPLVVRSRLVKKDVPILIGVTILFVAMAWSGISRGEGLLLVAICVAYLVLMVRGVRRSPVDAVGEVDDEVQTVWGAWLAVGVGAAALGIGADWLVGAAVGIAGHMGVPEVVIGLTAVSIGTSLPEVAASVAAALKKEIDLCAGNIIGSNLFNLVLVAGTVAVVSPLAVDPVLFTWELPVLLALTVILWPFFWTGRVVSRSEGAALLFFYVLFLGVTLALRIG